MPSLSSLCRGASAALPPFVPRAPAPSLARLYQLPQDTGSGPRDAALQRLWAAQASTKGWSGPAELLVSRDFCHHIFRSPGSLPAVFLQQSGLCQKYLFILPPSLFKSFLPSEEGAPGNTIHRADFLPAFHSWDPVGITPTHPLGAPTLPGTQSQFGWLVGKQPFPIPQRDMDHSLCANPQHIFYLV